MATVALDHYGASEKAAGLVLVGKRSPFAYDPTVLAPPFDEIVRILQKKGATVEDVLHRVNDKFVQDAKHSVAHLNGMGDEKAYDDLLINAYMNYELGNEFERISKVLKRNDEADLLPLFGKLSSRIAGQSTSLAPATKVDYKNYKPFMKSGYKPIDDIIGGIPSDGPIIAFGVQGVGKCLAKGTKVLMFDGTIKPVEEIKIGDSLMGIDSSPRTVWALGHGYDDMYDVIPTKGNPYTVNSGHVLSLRMSKRKNGKKADNKIYGHKPGELFNISIKDYINSSRLFKQYAMGWRTGIEFEYQDVPLDPYYLGAWLGDGDSNRPSITNIDDEVIDYIHEYADVLEMKVSVYSGRNDSAPSYMISNGYSRNKNPITFALESMNLINNKHIPHIYKSNSSDIRFKLLAGLMDTDGSLTHNCYDYVSKSKALADDVVFLSRSLGLSANVRPCQKVCKNNGKEGTYYRVTISGDTNRIPVKIERKKATCREQKKNVLNTHITVVPKGKGEYFGFTLDGDGLFLLEDFTVTHNSHFSECLSLGMLKKYPKKNVGIYTLEMSAEHYLWRATRMYKDIENYLDRLHVSGSVHNVNELIGEIQGKRLDFLVVDDMDRLAGSPSPEKYQEAYIRLSDICRFLKIPILILAQPNREAKLSVLAGERFLSAYDVSWSSGAENSAAMLIALQKAKLFDMKTQDAKGNRIEPMFPLDDEEREFIIFWKSRDGWPGDYDAKGQFGPGAVRLNPHKQMWMGDVFENRLWKPYSTRQSIGRNRQR